jgi:hypothetical protein
MGLINWIFDFYQQYRIDELRRDSVEARAQASAVRSAGGEVDPAALERSLGELALAVKALQRVMVAKGYCTVEEFHELLRQIDLEDGQLDGRAPSR